MIAILAMARALHLFSLMVLWGAGLYLALLARAFGIAIPARRQKRWAIALASVALVTAALWLLLAAGQISGDWHQATNPQTVLAVMTETDFGRIWIMRFAGLVLLWVAAWFEIRSVLAVSLAGLTLALLGLTSHAAAAGGLVRAINDGLHLLTAGFWVGSLLVLVELARHYRHEPRSLVGPFRLFSMWGMAAVAILLITGIINTVSILGTAALSLKNAYTDLLGIKITLALVMIGFAAVNRSQLLPALDNGEAAALTILDRNVAIELALGLLIVAIVGYLGLISPS